jgi:hypothetical protein
VTTFEATPDEVSRFTVLGVHRLIMRPAVRSREAVRLRSVQPERAEGRVERSTVDTPVRLRITRPRAVDAGWSSRAARPAR